MPSFSFERETGFEPATLGLGSQCSTTELLPQIGYKDRNFFFKYTVPYAFLFSKKTK